MDKFLDRTIKDVLLKNKKLNTITLIVPSERAQWEVKKSLVNQLTKPTILPKIESIHNYIISLSPLSLIDNYEAELILSKKAKLFDPNLNINEFYSKSPELIKDFNNIERYLINHRKLFYELSNIKDIENWSLNELKLSENQQKFIENYEKIGNLFNEFKKSLIEEKKGTSGMIYRDVAENLVNYLEKENNLILVGLNALSKSEELIIDYITKENKGEIYIDVDNFYSEDQDHEAGHFYRKHFLKKKIPTINYIQNSYKKINLHHSNTVGQQIEIVNNIINEDLKNQEVTIITMDESLGPIIYERIIKNNEQVNFSSGLNINYFECTKVLKFLLENALNGNINKDKINHTIFSSILNFKIFSNNLNNSFDIEEEFRKNKSYFISTSKISWNNQDFNSLLNHLSSWKINDNNNPINKLKTIIESLKTIYQSIEEEKKVLNQILDKVELIKHLLNNHNIELSSLQITNTLNRFINQIKIPIIGSKDAKIQILGLLESRAIDAKNIIYVSCNEDFLPKKDTEKSILPNDLKKYFGLPFKYEKEALFAYYFYRSLQYSTNIDLISVKVINKGLHFSEPSRYIKQIEKEFSHFSNINITKKDYTHYRANNNQDVVKDIKSIESINKWLLNGVSASSIINYNKCSLEFYYKYVLKLKEDSIPEKFIKADEWGTGIHKTLEKLYAENEIIDDRSLKKMLDKHDKFMDHEFQKIFKDKRHLKGKNAIVYYHYKKCINHFLNTELKNVDKLGSFKIIDVEKEIQFEDTIDINNNKKKIVYKGIIDRIDSTSNGIRLIDYKSGFVRPDELVISNLNSLNKKSKALQLLFYSMLYVNHYKHTDNITSQIISIKNTYHNSIDLIFNKEKKISNENIELFKGWIEEIILNISSDEIIFTHNYESKYCTWC